jgi:hypothetical protein
MGSVSPRIVSTEHGNELICFIGSLRNNDVSSSNYKPIESNDRTINELERM